MHKHHPVIFLVAIIISSALYSMNPDPRNPAPDIPICPPRPFTKEEVLKLDSWLRGKLDEIKTINAALLGSHQHPTSLPTVSPETLNNLRLILSKKKPVFLTATYYGYTDIMKLIIELLEKNIIYNLPPIPLATLLITPFTDYSFPNHPIKTTLLHWAIEQRQREIAMLLIPHAPDINIRDSYKCTPLHKEAVYGDLDIIDTLLAHRADINAQDQLGRTALHVASMGLNTAVVEYLIEHGASVDKDDFVEQTPLHHAARRGRIDIVTTLLAHGANPIKPDDEGKTPIHLSIDFNQRLVTSLFFTYLSKKGMVETYKQHEQYDKAHRKTPLAPSDPHKPKAPPPHNRMRKITSSTHDPKKRSAKGYL